MNPVILMAGVDKYIRAGTVPTLRNVSWGAPDAQPYTDGATIYLPSPTIDMDATDVLLWRYKIDHEVGHEHPVNARPHWREVMQQQVALNTTLCMIANLLSDHAQERNMVGLLPGRDVILLDGRRAFHEPLLDRIAGLQGEEAQRRMNSLFVLDYHFRAQWNPYLRRKVALDGLLRKVAALGDWTTLRNELDVWELAYKIERLLRQAPPPDLDQQQGDQQQGDQQQGGPPDEAAIEAAAQEAAREADLHHGAPRRNNYNTTKVGLQRKPRRL